MPNPKLAISKNEFFTYFKIEGMEGKFRIPKQVWNAEGIAMMIEGPSWDDVGINGFGKRHLLSTAGGNHAGDPMGKMSSILAKRSNGAGASRRGAKQRDMLNVILPKPANMQDKTVRETYNAKRQTASDIMSTKGYPSGMYGPNTDVCTFVLLDGMTLNQVSSIFAKALIKENFSHGQNKHVDIEFDSDRVVSAYLNGNIEYYWGINVDVKLHNSIYHIYHLNKAIEPSLELDKLFT